MFEYSLYNGKKQLKQGLCCLIASFIVGLVFVLLMLIPDQTAQLVVTIIFSIALSIISLITIIKIIFGAVVYHAERTASKTHQQVTKEQYKKEHK